MNKTMDNVENDQDKAECETIEGIVTARKCDCCGHHEMGITLESGEYVPLKPGMRVAIINR